MKLLMAWSPLDILAHKTELVGVLLRHIVDTVCCVQNAGININIINLTLKINIILQQKQNDGPVLDELKLMV